MTPPATLDPPRRRHPSTAAAPSWRTSDVCELAGVTYRVLDYWLRLGLFHMRRPTPGSGFARTWAPLDVTAARVAGRLAQLDAPTSILRAAVDLVYARDGIPDGAAVLVVNAGGVAYLGADVGAVPFAELAQPCWVVPVADLAGG